MVIRLEKSIYLGIERAPKGSCRFSRRINRAESSGPLVILNLRPIEIKYPKQPTKQQDFNGEKSTRGQAKVNGNCRALGFSASKSAPICNDKRRGNL